VLLQTRDQNKYAAQAYVLAEMAAFGKEYAVQMVANAKTLARALEQQGFTVLGKAKDYTETHQVILDLQQLGAEHYETRCQACNILVHKGRMMGDDARGYRTGARLSVQELTRQGMKQPEMERVAGFMRRAAIDQESPANIAGEIEEFLRDFQRLCYSFDA